MDDDREHKRVLVRPAGEFGEVGETMISYVSPKVKTETSSINGTGLFAKEFIKSGEIVCIQGGQVIDADHLNWPPYS